MRNSANQLPIKHWSHSSLVAFLRNPLAWYKRYVEEVYDMPTSPSAIVGRAGHVALQHFYGGMGKEAAIMLGLEHLRKVPDFEINFGKAKGRAARKARRARMEREYLQAIQFYLERPPTYDVCGVEIKGIVEVEGIPLPLKAVSDLVVRSKGSPRSLDIVDHKFVDHFSAGRALKPLYMIQAMFNYYVVRGTFKRPVRRFIVHECKKSRNSDGSPQLRRYFLDFRTCMEEFAVFRRLIRDATAEVARRRIYLPNPSDWFEGDNSFSIYRLGLVDWQSTSTAHRLRSRKPTALVRRR